ncbi:MAG TPA: hemolysin family protein [Clostridiaceae bacterium]|jgi:putative hemolysin|nr:HlyC/CorC family transporter [Clostridia bacterium]MED9925102.1 hemolysin family protein [Clostridia bacterium]CDC05734.1 cBS domain-containing protein [Clostridium sp. CAG:343]HCF34080.1 HlyC/CorC family transporter [Clostridiales bacterium]HJJ19259.1 hemolysin family protein [Clostridiaceae bacterium]
MLSQLIILAVLIFLNAFFAASEIAFISLNDTKIEKQAKDGNKKAKQIEKMLKTPSKFLATIQIGITLAGFLSSAFASDTFAEKLAPILFQCMPFLSLGVWKSISIIIITIILSFFTLVFGELVPKRLAMKNYEKIAFGTIGIIRAISIITSPFVKFLTLVTNSISKLFGVGENEEESVTEEEIKMMVDQGEEKGTIKEEEKELINNVFEFNDITASEIMKHRKDIFAVDINISNDELMEELSKEEYRYSRIPVYDETIDEIKGILYIKDVLKNIGKKNFKVKNVVKDAYFVSQTRLINEVFKELQKNKMQIAIIIDEYGGTAGLITMEDILEELVGDIYDEYDKEEKEFEKIDENTYIIVGSMPIYDVNKLLNANIPEGDYDTLSGFLQEKLGRIPEEEENPIIETKEVTYKIEKYEDKRILKVKACKNNEKQIEE